jgi:hypothetical protein
VDADELDGIAVARECDHQIAVDDDGIGRRHPVLSP